MSDLIVEFGQILETPTVFPDEQGRLEITVTNQGNEDAADATVNLYASTDTVLDDEVLNTSNDTISRPPGDDSRPEIPDGIDALGGTDELLGTIGGFDLAAGEEETFTIDFASDDFRTASVVSPGAYNLIAEVDSNNDSDRGNNQAVRFISSDGTDVVLDWNSTFLNAVQAEGKAERDEGLTDDSTTATIPGVAPPVVARDGAILHTAIYEAVNALGDSPSSSLNNLPSTPQGASQEAAAVGAAYTILSELFVEQNRGLSQEFIAQQQATFDLQSDRSLAEIGDDATAEDAGFNFGVEIAQTILTERSDDGASFAQVPYEPGTATGDYKEIKEPNPTNPLPNNLTENGLVETVALLPRWNRVVPFAIDSIARFRPEGPPAFSSSSYAADIERVRDLGGLVDTDITPVGRDEEETEIAQFWSYDRPDTFRPPGQWNEIAQEVALDRGNSLEENAALFAKLNVAMADAGIVAWDAKYTYEQLRPVTAIRNADDDNNPNTTADPDWEPLIGTPDFPDYISGHATFGGAAAGVLEDFFGNDVSFEIPTQELPGVSREFTSMGDMSSFEVAARENADSRLFGGVHVDISNVDGVAIGLDVADFVNEADIFI